MLVADVVRYSRLGAADEDRTLARLRTLRSDLIDPAIAAHHGRMVERTGDGSIIEFRRVVDAVRYAIEVQGGAVALRTFAKPRCLIADDSLAKPACALNAVPTREGMRDEELHTALRGRFGADFLFGRGRASAEHHYSYHCSQS
jgi:class 3 adenylate cyclase